MSFLERLWGNSQQEKEPFVPDELQNQILTIGSRWKMDGTPWWTDKVMSDEVERVFGKLVGTGFLYEKLHGLRDEGGVERLIGGGSVEKLPLRELPRIANVENISFYYQVTDRGLPMRLPLQNTSQESAPSPHAVPEA